MDSLDFLFDYLLYIGRFQPFHIGHFAVGELGLKLARHIIFGVGSRNQPLSLKNPFTYEQRREVITECYFTEHRAGRVHFAPLDDFGDNAMWVLNVAQQVNMIAEPGAKIGLIGNKKDFSSFYLDLFPFWEFVDAREHGTFIPGLNATDIRSQIFENDRDWHKKVRPDVAAMIEGFAKTPEFYDLKREYYEQN